MTTLVRPTIPDTAWIADTATVRGDVTLGEHVSVWFAAVIRGDEAPVSVGDNSNVQDGAVLHVSAGFPCVVGANVTIGHGAIVHGCRVDDGALIGMGDGISSDMKHDNQTLFGEFFIEGISEIPIIYRKSLYIRLQFYPPNTIFL